MRTSLVVAALVALSGCAVPSAARTADVLRGGEFRAGGYVGGTFGSEKLPDALPFEVAWNYGFNGRAGLPGNGICDVGAELGLTRLGGDLRCGLFNERRGDLLSVSPIVGAAWLPTRGYEWSVGADLGGTIRDSVKPLFNVSFSRGDHWWFSESSQPRHVEQSKYDRNVRKESRLSFTAGTAFKPNPDESAWVIFGVSPYWILNQTDPLRPGPAFSGVTFTVGGYGELGTKPLP